MSENIFRKKSLDKVKSPESLDDYIHVSNPGVWLLLVSVIVLLAGAIIWGMFGHIDSTVPTVIRSSDGTVVCHVAPDDITSIKVGMKVKFDGFEADVSDIGQIDSEGYACVLSSDSEIPEGLYNGKIVVESISPLSLILN